jgi:prepilin-type N-terminal cleavage/methylation domain-containing protein
MESSMNQRGFTTVELMVALVVMAFVVSQLLFSYTTQQRNYMEHERVIETQEEVRLISDLILSDLRMAGFMVPKGAGVGSIDGGTTGSDVICMSDPSIMSSTVLDTATSRFSAADPTSAMSVGATSVTLSASSMDIDGDGDDDFSVGQGILISTGTEVHCAVITAVSSGTVTFDTATSAAFPVNSWVVPALVYRITGGQLRRNNVVLSGTVEDIQIEFGVDADDDGEVEAGEFPVYDLTGDDLTKVYTARLYITSAVTDPASTFQGQFEAASNRNAASTPDTSKRRRVISDALLRNLR